MPTVLMIKELIASGFGMPNCRKLWNRVKECGMHIIKEL